jgi:hypothetical protein
MFSGHTSKKSETLFFLSDISDMKLALLEQAKTNGDNRSTFLESTQNYCITISNRRNFKSPFETNVVYLVFLKIKITIPLFSAKSWHLTLKEVEN